MRHLARFHSCRELQRQENGQHQAKNQSAYSAFYSHNSAKSFRTCDLRTCDVAFAWVVPLVLFDHGSYIIQYFEWQLYEIRRFLRVSSGSVLGPYSARMACVVESDVSRLLGLTSEARRAASCRVWKGLREGAGEPVQKIDALPINRSLHCDAVLQNAPAAACTRRPAPLQHRADAKCERPHYL